MLLRRFAGCGAQRRLACVATLLVAAAVAASASAGTIELAVHGGTGQVWLHNSNAVPFGLVYYSISSAGGALNPSNGVWTSIADTYDVSGDGSVDPDNEWTELNPTAAMLAEGNIFGAGGMLAVGQSVSLGVIWNPAAGMGDLTGQVVDAGAGSQPVAMPVVYHSYDGDFDFDFDVDLADLGIWRFNFGTGTLHVQGDADLDGDVDGDDFLQWQRDATYVANAGVGAGTGASLSALSVSAVPEPATAWLLCAGAGVLLLARRTFQRP
jgi:hypothetical protein